MLARCSSMARVRPAGPAPTMPTWVRTGASLCGAVGVRLGRDDHLERAWTVDSAHANHLDVDRGRGTRDERERAGRIGSELGDGLGDRGHDLVFSDYAQVIIGDERERAPAYPRPAVQHDRAGLRDRDGARRDDAVGGVQVVAVEGRVVVYRLQMGHPFVRNAGRDDDPSLTENLADRVNEIRRV